MYIPEEALKQICQEVNGTYGLFVSLPERGEKIGIHKNVIYEAASIIKIPLLALLMKDFEDGRLDPTEIMPLRDDCRVWGSGVFKSLSTDFKLSLYDYAVLMIILGDNSATNQIIEAVGLDRANAFFAENGWKDTYLAGKLHKEKPLLPNGNFV